MASAVQSSGRTGWYYRVLSSGVVGPEDRLKLVARRSPGWTIARIWRAFYIDTLNPEELARLSEVPALAEPGAITFSEGSRQTRSKTGPNA